MSSNKTTITSDETLRNETNDVTKEALRNAAEKTGEVMERLGLASGRTAIDTTEVKLPVSQDTKEELSEEKQKLQESYEKGKANARREKALLGDPKAVADSDIAGLSVLERAQLAADEVYRAAGETPVATDHEGGFLETATVMASNTVDLIKQAAAKTAEQATSAAAHVTQALDGGALKVDLSEIEQKRAQEKVNNMKAEQQELEDQAAKKKREVKEEVVANRVAGKPVQEPTSVNFNDATSTSATGILKTVGDKVSETITLVKGAVTGAAAETTTTTPTSTSTTPSNVDVVRAT